MSRADSPHRTRNNPPTAGVAAQGRSVHDREIQLLVAGAQLVEQFEQGYLSTDEVRQLIDDDDDIRQMRGNERPFGVIRIESIQWIPQSTRWPLP